MSRERRAIEGQVEGRNTGVPANIIISGSEQLFTVIGLPFVMWLEPEAMVFVLGARANRSPQITSLSPCGSYTGVGVGMGYRFCKRERQSSS